MQDDPNILIVDDIRVEFVELGEGLSGDYDENNPDDVELLRFDVFVRPTGDEQDYDLGEFSDETGAWVDPGDASYCCGIPVTATPEQKQAALRYIASHIGTPPRKHAMQACSWIALNEDGSLFTTSADEMLGVIGGR